MKAAMSKYRKRPVVIEAEQFTGMPLTDMTGVMILSSPEGLLVEVHTLEGTMRGPVGCYVITGVRGERYPCAADIFAATYEPVEDDAPLHVAGHTTVT